jgi:hypothetical protein
VKPQGSTSNEGERCAKFISAYPSQGSLYPASEASVIFPLPAPSKITFIHRVIFLWYNLGANNFKKLIKMPEGILAKINFKKRFGRY